ncbi:hypothetical protein V1523DRAFT_222527 [Lipomyces doorenjongii]
MRKGQLQRRTKNQIGVPTWAGFDLDDETHEEFVEAVSSFLKLHNSHEYVASLQPLRTRATLSATFLVDNGFSIASNGLDFEKDDESHVVTRQQVYNFWLSLTKKATGRGTLMN